MCFDLYFIVFMLEVEGWFGSLHIHNNKRIILERTSKGSLKGLAWPAQGKLLAFVVKVEYVSLFRVRILAHIKAGELLPFPLIGPFFSSNIHLLD